MINGFEKETSELSEYERLILLPGMVKGLETKIGKENSITASKAIQKLRLNGYKVTPARFRKVVHHIRVNGLVPLLLATTKGYHVATSIHEAIDFVESLDQRMNSIMMVRDSIDYQAKQAMLKKRNINN